MALKFNPFTGTFDTVLDKAVEILVDNTGWTDLSGDNVQAALNSVDNIIATLPDPITYAGTWDASTNTPTLDNTDTGVTGFLYQVNVAGTVDFGAGNISFEIGDKVVNNGTIWEKWDMTDAVISVNSQTGVVVLDSDDVAEGASNLYFTNSRAQAAITGGASSIVTSNLTSNRALASDASGKVAVSATTDTELGYVSGVTSAIQTQLNAKEPTITVLPVSKGGTNSGTALSNNRIMRSDSGAIVEAAAITANRALISDANGIPTQSATTDTELGYVSGVTSALQTQLNAKQPLWQTLAVSSDVTLTASRIHLVDTSAVRSLTLPAVAADLVLMVKDASGSAETNNITITPASGTIDGAASLVISSAYGSAYLVSNGTNWFIC